MSHTTTLFSALMKFIFDTGVIFHDIRVASTLGWSVVGLLISETVHLNQWALYRPGKATLASKEKQLSRWMHNDKIRPLKIIAPLVTALLKQFEGERCYIALDTTMLWNRFAIVRLAFVYRGRALPVSWVVLNSRSATVSVVRYRHILIETAALFPDNCAVVLLADRGFLHIELMKLCQQLGWHYRIRAKISLSVHRATKKKTTIRALMPPIGYARCYHNVFLTKHRFPVHIAIARLNSTTEWVIISDEPTSLDTFDTYALRFSIEENFLDDKSNGFQLESSHIADCAALSRLCLVLAIATFYLNSTGTAVVEMGRRPLVDPHWERGLSYFNIGWRWVKRALFLGETLLTSLWFSPQPDPFPSHASRRQALSLEREPFINETIDDMPCLQQSYQQFIADSLVSCGLGMVLVLFHSFLTADSLF